MNSFPYTDLPPVADVSTWAQILDVHTDSVRKACRTGELKYVTLGRLWRIPRHAIVEWLTQCNDPTGESGGVDDKEAVVSTHGTS